MKTVYLIITLFLLFAAELVSGQPWEQNDAIFNPSGVPSLPFSQPRFADLDGDGNPDMIIGSIEAGPFYMENTGSATNPAFVPDESLFSGISSLDAEVGICCDIDNDGDLDFISGGYTGLNLFLNTGTVNAPVFEKSEGFFAGLITGEIPVPDMADIDNDGDPDLVVGMSASGLVKLYTNTGSPTSASFDEINVSEIGDVGLYAYPAFCDLDDDQDQDLLVGRDEHGFVYYQNIGDPNNAIWQIDPEVFAGIGYETYWNSPGLTDLNGDEKFDLVFGTAAGPLNYYVNTGSPSSPAWQANTSLFGGVLDVGAASNPFFFDFDGDGDLDMFSGSQLGDIWYFENTGTPTGPAWEENSAYFTSLKHSIYSAVAIGDVNGDGLPDAIVGDLSGKLYYHRNTGTGFFFESEILQNIALGGWSAPRLADIDFDDDLDIVVGNEAGILTFIENQGSPDDPDWVEISGYFAGIDVGTNCVPALCDIDFDGDFDLVCGNLWGDVICYKNREGNWIETPGIVQGISGGQNAAPAFGDLDADGDQDLALGQYSGVFNYFRNQVFVTGLSNQSAALDDIYPSVYPNPFTDDITVEFNNPGQAVLSIYNIQGQLIFTDVATLSYVEIDLSDLKPGIYLLTISGGYTPKTIQLVKQ